jgi:hypothetical protein
MAMNPDSEIKNKELQTEDGVVQIMSRSGDIAISVLDEEIA